MNWRWLLLDHVPDGVRLTREERKELTVRIRKIRLPLSIWTEIGGFLLTCPFIVLWLIVWPWIWPRGAQPPNIYGGMVRVIVFWSVLWFIFAAVNHVFRRKHTIVSLRDMGYELCTQCGYWLRGLDDNVERCPECGAPREPMLPAPKDETS